MQRQKGEYIYIYVPAFFFFAQDRSYFEHKLKAGSLCQACWSSIARSFHDPSDLPLLSCFRFVIRLVCVFVFFQISSKSFQMFCFAWFCYVFRLTVSLLFHGHVCLPYPLTVTQAYADGLTYCCPWPLLCFQVNDASQYVIMGIDNKLNILRFGQTCPCLKP